MENEKITVFFQQEDLKVEVPAGITLLEAARLAGVRMVAPCAGKGRCGKCLAKITTQHNGSNSQLVLACQTEVNQAITVELPKESSSVLQQGLGKPVSLEPAVFMDESGSLKHRATIPLATRQGPLLGLAVDLGTTTMVAYLYDLAKGVALSTAASENGQFSFGADVMTRLAYAQQGEKEYRELRQALVVSLNKLLLACCRQAAADPLHIREIVIVGNTPMVHVLLKLSLASLTTEPFQPTAKGPFYRQAAELGLTVSPQAICYFPPFIGGFVGSDALAAIISQGLGQSAANTLLVDIGTNGEILLQAEGRLLAASAPAGPALEGGNISCGMIAAAGAIQRVLLDYDVHIEVIGDQKPIGLCGSALVDAIAELLRLGLIERTGRLLNASELPPIVSFRIKHRIHSLEGKSSFSLSEGVIIEQKDIREVQLAKAAIAAGIEVILAEAGLKSQQLDKILLAGGFGNYLNTANALRMGLLGELALAKVQQVGNAAGAGAIMLLLSYSTRKTAEALSKHIQHIELAAETRYQEAFLQHINFPEKEYI